MIYTGVLLFALGVILATFFDSTLEALFLGVLIVSALFVYGVMLKVRGRQTWIVGVVVVSTTLCLLGFVRTEQILYNQHPDIQALEYTFVQITGRVSGLPEKRETSERIVLEDVSIDGVEQERLKALLWVDRGMNIRTQDTIRAQGVVRLPQNFETNTGRTFDYVSYLSKDDIYIEMRDPQEVNIFSFNGVSLLRLLESIKKFFIYRMESVLPEPHSSLAGGILLGEKQSLGDLWQEKFRIVGLTHIVVLSGYNIAIVVAVILFLLSSLSLLWSSVIGLLGIIGFAMLVGGGATVVRASIMASLLIVARLFHRPHEALRGLFLAGFVMMLWNPRILVYDLSFQLSFLATLGIIVFTPIAERIFGRVSEAFGLREILVTTFSAQLFVLPWIAYSIGDFSVVSFVANLLVLPVIPLAMLVSFIAGVMPFAPVAFPAYVLLEYVLSVTETLSNVPYASVDVPQLPLWLVVSGYGILFFVTLVLQNKKPIEIFCLDRDLPK